VCDFQNLLKKYCSLHQKFFVLVVVAALLMVSFLFFKSFQTFVVRFAV